MQKMFLRRARKEKKLTSVDVSEMTGLHKQTVLAAEKGKKSGYHVIEMLLDVYGFRIVIVPKEEWMPPLHTNIEVIKGIPEKIRLKFPRIVKIVINKEEWIGGKLHNLNCILTDKLELGDINTTITEIGLQEKNKKWMFIVNAVKCSCTMELTDGRIIPGEKDWLTFLESDGHMWRIQKA